MTSPRAEPPASPRPIAGADLDARVDLALDLKATPGLAAKSRLLLSHVFPDTTDMRDAKRPAVRSRLAPRTHDGWAMHSLRLRQLAELSSREWLWLLKSLGLLPLAWVSIRLLGWQQTMATFQRIPCAVPVAGHRTLDSHQPDRSARMVRVAATFGPARLSCLPRAVVLWTLMRRQGHDAVVRLAVRKGLLGVDAHAWVEVNGLSLDDATNEPFRTFTAAPFLANL